MEEIVRLIIVADDPLARAGLSAILALLPGFSVATQGSSEMLFDATVGAVDVPADVIVWDVGWETADRDGEEPLGRSIPVLALVSDDEGAARAWRAGCRGILSRGADEEKLSSALSAVAASLMVLAPSLATSLLKMDAARDAPLADLTPRESEVLLLLAEGLTNKAVAQRLAISDHTVKFHVNSILNKLDAQSRTDAVVRATRLGLIAL